MTLTVEGKPTFAPIATDHMTIEQVASEINRQLRGTEIEPEWLIPANFLDDPNEATFGPLCSRLWPTVPARDRLAVSVHRGWSEGWHVYIDWICHLGKVPSLATSAQKLLKAKTLSSKQAWAVACAISTMLDIA
ncbi:hypothetical protein [Cupriavidus sp. WS]|uniref:hypothetical protein n=1 Tax=Cupriavidus sp. WS TaxID=1312922 RepID=UPI0012DF35C4|nr:hypothetical protein [Cupriavidus sp. WS]